MRSASWDRIRSARRTTSLAGKCGRSSRRPTRRPWWSDGTRCEMVKKHAQGFFVRPAGWRTAPYELRAQLWDGREVRDRRSLPLRAADFRVRSLPALRRHALRGLADVRRAPGGERGRQRRAFRGMGAQCGDGFAGRRVQRLGHAPPSHAAAQRRRLGALHARSRGGRLVQVQRALALRRLPAAQGRSYAFYCELPPKSASRVWDTSKYEWQRRGLDGGPAPRSTC